MMIEAIFVTDSWEMLFILVINFFNIYAMIDTEISDTCGIYMLESCWKILNTLAMIYDWYLELQFDLVFT